MIVKLNLNCKMYKKNQILKLQPLQNSRFQLSFFLLSKKILYDIVKLLAYIKTWLNHYDVNLVKSKLLVDKTNKSLKGIIIS